MSETRRKYTEEFKRNAVTLTENPDRSITDIARDLGVERSLLSRWKKESEEEMTGIKAAFVGKGNPRDEELNRLRRENAELRETNEILKKAMAIFARKDLR